MPLLSSPNHLLRLLRQTRFGVKAPPTEEKGLCFLVPLLSLDTAKHHMLLTLFYLDCDASYGRWSSEAYASFDRLWHLLFIISFSLLFLLLFLVENSLCVCVWKFFSKNHVNMRKKKLCFGTFMLALWWRDSSLYHLPKWSLIPRPLLKVPSHDACDLYYFFLICVYVCQIWWVCWTCRLFLCIVLITT